MIASLSGTITEKTEKSLTIDVQGIGYLVTVPREISSKCIIGAPCSLLIRMVVREDDLLLYGFGTQEQRALFDLLLTVTRVGPKMAMDILDTSLPRVKLAIIKRDLAFLSGIPGVGKKMAERISVELHDKLRIESPSGDNGTVPPHQDITEALQKLGYQRTHVARILQDMPRDVVGEKAIIQYFLQHA